jgi:type IV secretory pathway VirB10-like protein
MNMPEKDPGLPLTVSQQPEARLPLRKSLPVVVALIAVVGLIGISNVSTLLNGRKKGAPTSALTISPTTPDAQQVSNFETQQQIQARHDVAQQQRQKALAVAMEELKQEASIPGPESANTRPMTTAQRAEIYGDSPNAPKNTSNSSEAQAEAKQKRLAIEKRHQDALNSDTVALDFSREDASPSRMAQQSVGDVDTGVGEEVSQQQSSNDGGKAPFGKVDPMSPYTFDRYQGRLYRVFEGTLLEGVVTNHIDAGLTGPILVMLTTDYYSHDHQQLLMPQGTRLIGNVQSVGTSQQRKMFVTFHRAVCPDGFSLDFDKNIGLDQIGTSGLATKVDHGYLMAFGAAAAIGGLGGLAQIGNNGTAFDPSTQIRNGISAQTAAEGQQVLNHFLNRLPVITLKEGSRARIYIGHDLLIPSYAEHRVDPAL